MRYENGNPDVIPKSDLEVANGNAISERIENAAIFSPGDETSDINSRNEQGTPFDWIMAESVEKFRTQDGEPYVQILVNGYYETLLLRSRKFAHHLRRRFLTSQQKPLSDNDLKRALDNIEAETEFGDNVREVYNRIAEIEGKIYIDLCDPERQVVEVTREGWKFVNGSKIPFFRSRDCRPLPVPQRNGDIETFRSFTNVASDDDFTLLVSWLLKCLRPGGPFPLLAIHGEQGSAKSTLCRFIRSLIDPRMADLISLPKEESDLLLMAKRKHMLAFDNTSKIPDWLSDAFCRLATGAGIERRTLYTDAEVTTFTATRPVLLNGIEQIISRSDLANRTIFIRLNPISPNERRTQLELQKGFDQCSGEIFGALLDGLVHGLRRFPEIKLSEYPRMADFARFSSACETAYWPIGAFEKAYRRNLTDASFDVIGENPFARTLLDFIDGCECWEGTATELEETLARQAGRRVAMSPDWPRGARAASSLLARLEPPLRTCGVEVTRIRLGHSRNRIIRLQRIPTINN